MLHCSGMIWFSCFITEYRFVARYSCVHLYWLVVKGHSILDGSVCMYILYDFYSVCGLWVIIFYASNKLICGTNW